MSPKTPYTIPSLIVLALLSGGSVRAEQEGHGGDTLLIRAKSLENYIQGSLKADLTEYFQVLDTAAMEDRESAKTLSTMIRGGVAEDIRKSRYVFSDSCKDSNGHEKPATAVNRDRDGEICFDTMRLVERKTSRLELVALTAHEHAHHFGVVDEEHDLAAAVYDELSSPSYRARKKRIQRIKSFDGDHLVDVRFEFQLPDATIAGLGLKKESLVAIYIDSNGDFQLTENERIDVSCRSTGCGATKTMPARKAKQFWYAVSFVGDPGSKWGLKVWTGKHFTAYGSGRLERANTAFWGMSAVN